MMMNEIEVSIGGIVEARRVNTMKRINSEVEYVVQDNNDLEDMKLLYEKLPLSKYDRDIIDSIFCCIQSRNEMVEKLAYYAGLSDAVEFLKQQGRFSGPFSTFKYQLLCEQMLRASSTKDRSSMIKSYILEIIVDTLNNKSWKNSDN